MTCHPVNQPFMMSVVFSAWLLSCNSSAAEQADPTTPSPQIEARLFVESEPQTVVAPITVNERDVAKRFSLRIKAVVLRDDDNGTAIIAMNETNHQIVPLRRKQSGAAKTRVSLGGTIFEVIDFAESFIVLGSLDGRRQWIVN